MEALLNQGPNKSGKVRILEYTQEGQCILDSGETALRKIDQIPGAVDWGPSKPQLLPPVTETLPPTLLQVPPQAAVSIAA